MTSSADRSAYRIPYPPTARPSLTFGGHVVEVHDCSERGIRIQVSASVELESGSRISGELRMLHARETYEVEGVVLRRDGQMVAVELDAPGIPLRAMFAEQRYLSRRFPLRYLPST